MKQYYIDKFITYCYPYETSKPTKNYGVLTEYMGKYFDRNEIDKIICELITRHPYVENSMRLEIRIMWNDETIYSRGFYHILDLKNDNFIEQTKGSLDIKYEK